MFGSGRGRNSVRHTTCNFGYFKHTHIQINPIRHTTCNSENLLYDTYRKQLDDGIIIFKKHQEYIMGLYKSQRVNKYLEELIDTDIHWKAKNNHFRFSLLLFTFFTLILFLEK